MSTNDPWRWPEIYLDAHRRHWESAELLFREGLPAHADYREGMPANADYREWMLANADHLYGLSAECGLKAIIQIRYPELLQRQQRRREEGQVSYFRHINELWRLFYELMSNSQNAENTGELNIPEQNPFDNWRIDQRYACRRRFTLAFVGLHREGARQIYCIVRNISIAEAPNIPRTGAEGDAPSNNPQNFRNGGV